MFPVSSGLQGIIIGLGLEGGDAALVAGQGGPGLDAEEGHLHLHLVPDGAVGGIGFSLLWFGGGVRTPPRCSGSGRISYRWSALS